MSIEFKKFEVFDVYYLKNNYSFFHIKIKENEFYEELSNWILKEDNLIKYIKNSKEIDFEYDDEALELMYDLLYLFIDKENDEMDISSLEIEIQNIIEEEAEEIRTNKTNKIIRLSKIGRFGEFIMSTLLREYFKFDCIIPKLKMTTDRNMSVYGIDTIYMDTQEKLLLFGESKISKNLKNAIKLINHSLKEYENNIEEEYMLILKNNCLKKLKAFEDYYEEQRSNGVCIKFKDFIRTAKISNIGIPIFMAHGEEVNSEEILEVLNNSINKVNLFELDTKYYLISLPILDKSKFSLTLTKKIKEKKDYYESIIRNNDTTKM